MLFQEYFTDDFSELDFSNSGEDLNSIFSDEMIVQSVQEASDFFNLDDPLLVVEDFTTGVFPNMAMTESDDFLIFNREQLLDMGITEKDGLDLVMTHESAHRALQGLGLGLNPHQEELCCDFMSGVRAGLNGIDVSQMKLSLADTVLSESHPEGAARVDSIESGVQFAQEYMEEYGHAPTFSECMSYFMGESDLADIHEEDFDSLIAEGDMEGFKGYTQSEIDSHIAKAKHEMQVQESNMRHREYMIKSKERMGEPNSYEKYQYDVARRKWEEAKDDYNKWKRTKAED